MQPSPRLQSLIEHSISSLNFLTPEQAHSFLENGFVVVKNAFPQDMADQICGNAWAELHDEFGIVAEDRNSWRRHPHGYIRTNGRQLHFKLDDEAPNAALAQCDVLGGRERLPHNGSHLMFAGGVIANFGVESQKEWEPPSPRQGGWHKDGWHFRHFLDSPEQGLLTVPIYTEVLPQSGGTFLARDSISHVARLLLEYPAGFHADSVQGAGYLIPYLIEQCNDFVELTGEPGDLALLHPYMLHRRAVNPTDRPRFIANLAIVLEEPMCFQRDQEDPYSLVELAVLTALDKSSLDHEPANPREAFVPAPFRKEPDATTRRAELKEEMRIMLESGVETPSWGSSFGYMTNNPDNH
ncbi:MAG: phytanoyl-CoA dioxygenase family protein [Gammaproteobacteria bacterium]|nr:phytanoyl-CoA dioxygenase family protein [Gammaproteobacteria bacterium]MYD81425.1 phytanoyl-CoA dioxygenase family protein [Gammaproteobacteria bacterium]